jgi:Fe-S oxidoreductase
MERPPTCELCGRAVEVLTRHHLIPRTRHKNKKNKKLFERSDVKSRILWICQACHDTIHSVLTEKELERTYNTPEALAAHPEIKKFTDWIRTKPESFGVKVKESRRMR